MKNLSSFIAQNTDLTFNEMCIKNNELNELKKCLEASENFPVSDRVYKKLLEHFKEIKKHDFHCHLTMGLSIKQIVSMVSEYSNEDFLLVKNNIARVKTSRLRNIIISILWLLPNFLLRKKSVLRVLVSLSRITKLWDTASFYIVSKKSLREATKQVSLNYLNDNVTKFSFRMNLFRSSLFKDNKDDFTVFCESLCCVVEGQNEAALVTGVPKENLNVIITLNRSEGLRNLEAMKNVMERISDIPPRLLARIKGFDLAGPEGVIDSVDIKQWNEVITFMPFKFTPHVGDMRNLKKGTELYNLWQEFLVTRDSHILDEFLKIHAEFVFEYVDSMQKQSGIAHGISISNNPLFLEFVDNKRTVFAHEAGSGALTIINETKKLILEKEITICFCPSATVKSMRINDFSKLPLYEWIEDGIHIKIGIDGMFQDDMPRLLSEELLKVFITQPKYGNQLKYREVIALV